VAERAEHSDVYRKIAIMLAAAGLGVSVAACSSPAPGQDAASEQVAPTAAVSTPASPSVAVASATARRSSSPAASLRLLTEPAAGIGPVYKLITGARHSVDLTMYELADPTAEADLAADAARGVDVRVLLDRHLEKARNTSAYNYLNARRVHVRWAPAGTTYHQKTLTVDDATSVIMTLNLVASDYSGTRDFAVIDTGRADVAAIVATFNADFAGRAVTPPDGTGLVPSGGVTAPAWCGRRRTRSVKSCRSSTGPSTPWLSKTRRWTTRPSPPPWPPRPGAACT
jgi:hypothetical protein